MRAMSESRTTRDAGLWIRLLGAVVGVVFAVAPIDAGAYYYGHYYGGYGHYYGGYGHYYGGYAPYYGGYGYHYYGPYDYPYYGGGYSSHGSYGHHGGGYGLGGLLYGILSIPAYVVGSIFGFPHGYGHSDDIASADDGGTTAAPKTVSNASGGVSQGGWTPLAEGHYTLALSMFADEASSHPTEGRPKVGYALAAAAGGNLRRGVWAMRRAFRIDPEAVRYMTMDSIDEALRPRVEAIIASYVEDPYDTLDDAEATFMLASLYYLLRERESARNAIKVALADDDYPASTANLNRLIEQDLERAPADGGATTEGGAASDGESSGDDY